jgi:hypothetical protein
MSRARATVFGARIGPPRCSGRARARRSRCATSTSSQTQTDDLGDAQAGGGNGRDLQPITRRAGRDRALDLDAADGGVRAAFAADEGRATASACLRASRKSSIRCPNWTSNRAPLSPTRCIRCIGTTSAAHELDLVDLIGDLWSAWPPGFPAAVRDATADANDVRMRPIGEGFASTHTRVEVTIEGLALALGPERWEKLQGPCCTR